MKKYITDIKTLAALLMEGLSAIPHVHIIGHPDPFVRKSVSFCWWLYTSQRLRITGSRESSPARAEDLSGPLENK